MDLGNLVVKLRADLTGLSRNLKRGATEIRTFATGVATQMRAATASVKAFAVTTMAGMVSSIRRYARLAGLALAAIGVAVVKMAVDVREDMNFFRESFKDAAKEVNAWAKDVSESLYMNQNEVRTYAVTFNEMLQGMGVGSKMAVEMSKRFVEMNYDLASFRNLKPEEAFDKMSAALVGMSRPMRDIGYDISETAIAEEALAMGIKKSVETMTQAEKIAIRYQRMIRLLKNAHGDMNRTLDEAANVFRGIWAKIIEIGQKVGEVILKRIHEPAKDLRDFLAENQDMIVVYFDTILTNLINIANYIRSDFSGALELAGTIILETLKGIFETITATAKVMFTTLGKNIPGWIQEGLTAAATKMTGMSDASLKGQALEAYRARTGDVKGGTLAKGLLTTSGSNITPFAEPDVYLEELEALQMAAGEQIDSMTLKIRALRKYLEQYPEDTKAQALLQSLQSASIYGTPVSGSMMDVQDPMRLHAMGAQVQREWAAGIKAAEEESGLGAELDTIWANRMAKIRAAFEKAGTDGGLEIVTPEQIEALHETERAFAELYETLDAAEKDLQSIAESGLQVATPEQLQRITEARQELDYLRNILDEAASAGELDFISPDTITALNDTNAELAELNNQLVLLPEAADTADKGMKTWAERWEETSVQITNSIGSAFSDLVSNMEDAEDIAVSLLQSIMDAISQAIYQQYLYKSIQSAVSGLGGGTGEAAAMSKGGIVYAQNGLFVPRGTDTVPAMLTPGEGVLDKDTTSRLRRILAVPEQMNQPSRTMNVTVNAIDAQNTARFFQKNRQVFGTMLGLNKQTNHPGTR